MNNKKRTLWMSPWICAFVAMVLGHFLAGQVAGARIRDVARLKSEVPNELIGMGLVVGLNGTGDGGDFLPAMRPLKEMMKRFDNPVVLDKEMKNANNVAIVSISMQIPPQGANDGERLDVKVAALAAKSLKGGRLFIVPMLVPRTDTKIVLGFASGDVIVDDDKLATTGTIRGGGVLIRDVLPEEIKNGQFTLVLRPNTANMETATAVADRINEEVSAQTDGKPVAVAVDATSINVTIPKVELGNTTAFIARIRSLPLPNISQPAKVIINTKSKTIVFTDEVEISQSTVTAGGMTVTIGATPTGPADPTAPRSNTASMQDLENAFNLLKVGPDDRIKIVEMLHDSNSLKADVEIQ